MRRRFVFSGRVQGVGFRATARHIAHAHPLTGWVRNDPEGSVTLEIQGESGDIARFIDELRTSMLNNIDAISSLDLDVLAHEDTFRIAY